MSYLKKMKRFKTGVDHIPGLYIVSDYLSHSYLEAVVTCAEKTAHKIIM